MKLVNWMKKAFTTADHAVKAVVGATEEARPAPRTYGRWNRSPANADKPLRPGDRVLPSGQVVAPDAPLPPGERFVFDEGASISAEPAASNEIRPDFFAARQALADRRSR